MAPYRCKFISNLKRLMSVMCEKMNTSLSVVIVVHGVLNVVIACCNYCVVIAAYHNHIIKGW